MPLPSTALSTLQGFRTISVDDFARLAGSVATSYDISEPLDICRAGAVKEKHMRDFRDQSRTHRGHRHDGEGWEGRRRGGRMRRGDIRTALLAILAEEPGHGYDVIQRLEEKTAGAWRPSPGSVYPTLQLLEDEGLARSGEHAGKRVYEITVAGRAESARRVEEAGGTPWEIAGRSNNGVG